MTRLIVHIGAAKCGSSAIQAYLMNNQPKLRDIGVVVPCKRCTYDGDVTGDHIWFFEALRPFDAEKRSAFLDRILKVKDRAEKTGASTIVLSAENLINPDGAHNLFVGLEKYFDLEVIAYLRRQDDYLMSAWQQWYVKETKDFHGWLDRAAGTLANWEDYIRPWESVVEPQKIKLRLFSRPDLVNGDAVDDFFATVRIPQDSLDPLVEPMNRSFDEALVRVANNVNDVFQSIHDNEFYTAMAFAIGKDAFKKTSGSSLLTLAERLEVYSRYEESNDNIKRKYFAELGEGRALFPPPTEADVITLDDKQKQEEEIAVLARGIFRMAKLMMRHDIT